VQRDFHFWHVRKLLSDSSYIGGALTAEFQSIEPQFEHPCRHDPKD